MSQNGNLSKVEENSGLLLKPSFLQLTERKVSCDCSSFCSDVCYSPVLLPIKFCVFRSSVMDSVKWELTFKGITMIQLHTTTIELTIFKYKLLSLYTQLSFS